MTQADETLAALYGSLQLEDDVFESDANDAITDVHLLERQLRDRLGNEACRTLGQLLINNEQDLRQAV